MTPYSLPAFAALVFKLVLFAYAAKSPVRNSNTRLFLLLLVALSLFNLSEVLALNYFPRFGIDGMLELVGYGYFATIIIAIAVLLHLSLRFALEHKSRSPLPYALLYLPVAMLEGLLLFTDNVVAGFRPFQFSIIRIPGQWYFLFETYFTVYLAGALVNLMLAARGIDVSSINRTRNRLWLIGFAPMALLMIYTLLSRHMDWPQISSTFYVPIAQTFFLLVATYATHQYRLFDIEFYIPWSRIRKRKTEFYKRIQATIAEIAELRSVREVLQAIAETLRCQVALIGGPRPIVALAPGQKQSTGEGLTNSNFPSEALARFDHIIVANEIADSAPELHGFMQRHKVGAIVPFNSHSATAGHWMLLGEHFSDNVYSPLDFKRVEALFDKIGERFLDDLLLLRSQVNDAKEEIGDYRRRLVMAWDELTRLRPKLTHTEIENRRLREENARMRREQLRLVTSEVPPAITKGEKRLEQYLAEFEEALLTAALKECRGDKNKAARLLGVSPDTLSYLMTRHHLDLDQSIE